jgi:tetratricopeptide (TPR) repeat protein
MSPGQEIHQEGLVSDFDRIFEPQYSAVDLFTDRLSESEIFTDSLLRHLERMGEGVTSLSQPRQNVLTFYGIGGIGKTELSRRLQRWLDCELSEPGHWGPAPRLDQQAMTVRFDFHGSSAVNAADIVLRLRGAVAAPMRHFPAFDLGLAAWWGAAYPGTALPDIRSYTGFDVKGQITDTLNDILNEAGARFGLGPLTVRVADQIVRAVLTHHRHRKVLGECAPLEALVAEARRDPSPYVAATLAGLLTWDLERLHIAERPVVVAFADAVEYVQAGNRLQERLLNRVISLTPGILWVITSRDRLDWDSPHLGTVLAASGPSVWPGLPLTARSEPRQHLIGDLSDTDVVRYLNAASGTSGNPVLGDDVIEAIRSGAHGLPLYLDLSLQVARNAPISALDPVDFGGSLPALVISVFATLPPEERDLARTASLLPRFDPGIIAQAVGRPIGEAQLFCRRSLVIADSHPLFPFRLHDAVRSAIAGESAETSGAWTREDRAARAGDLVKAFHVRHEELRDKTGQRRDVLELVAHLCAAHDLRPAWLLQALTDLPGMARTAARLPPPSEETWIGHVSRFFDAWRGHSTRERIAYLSSLVEGSLPVDVNKMARRWLAYTHTQLGEYDKALAIFEDLLAENPESDISRYQIARNLRALGRYEDLDLHLSRFPIETSSLAVLQKSELAFDRGYIMLAVEGAAERARYLFEAGKHRTALENKGVATWWAALGGQASIADCDSLIAEADLNGAAWTLRTALAAKALCLLGSPSVHDLLDEIALIIYGSTGRRGWREWTVGLLHAIRCEDRQLILNIREEWESRSTQWSPNLQVIDRIFVLAGFQATYPPIHLADVNESARIEQRWRTIIEKLVATQQEL